MFHYIVQVRGGLEQDPQVFEGLHMFNNVASNTNSQHGLVEQNTMIFVFFMFTISSRSTQNCWSMFNCCYNLIFNFDIKTTSLAKSNSHTCKFAKAGASHFVLCKCPSEASKYSPNNRGLRRQPCFTFCWHLKLEVTPLFGWLMRTVSQACIAYMHCKKRPSTLRPTNTCHSISRDIISNAFLKSTKQHQSGFFFALLCSIKVHNMKSWSVVW